MIRPARFVLAASHRNVARAMVLAGALAVALGLLADPQRTWADLLMNGFYTIAIALGGMVFISLQYLSGAKWPAGIRRVPEAMMSALPVAAVLMLTLFFGRHWIYPWSRAGAFAGELTAGGKATYLSAPFFFARMALIVIVWATFAYLMRRSSLRQDGDAAPIHHRHLVRYSAAFTVVFAISFSLASFDWLMTLDPRWTSTVFAIYMFAGVLLQGIAAITLIVVLLRERGYLTDVINAHHLHDLGKLLFAFSTFWAYIWLSQYLLIWYGNLPDEVTYYVRRTGEAWIALFFLNVVLNWAVPFLVLLPRSSKRSAVVLKWVAIVILTGRWLDLYLTVMPEMAAAPKVGVLDALIAAGYAGVIFLLATSALASAPLVALNDPNLRASLAHHQ
jgi:hypothetical protein